MKYFSLLFLLFSLTSCSTLISGKKQRLIVNSNVREAVVFVNGEKVGTTPLDTKVKRRKEMKILVKKPGYFPHDKILDTSLDLWIWTNFFNYGIGALIDYFQSNTHLLDRDTHYVELRADQEAVSPKPMKKRKKKLRSEEFLR